MSQQADPDQQRLAKELEDYKLQLQLQLENHRAELQQRLQANQAEITRQVEAWKIQRQTVMEVNPYGLMGIRSLLIANGGAIIALLAFVGNMWGKEVPTAGSLAERLLPAFYCFSIGIACALITCALGYITQVIYAEYHDPGGRRWPLGNVLRGFALLAGTISFIGFVLGSYEAVRALAFTSLTITALFK